ncbi:6-carboxytetrahydropterin synthase [Pantoea phage vB_PagS_Vid5]|uniref:6-carboxytetrahydropterin synthase n=1 Tax=Pantoea phage vB_PagS_Vid5 TaxID=2099652 RepID=A0A2P1CKK6_9CAUD|nr:QueD-like 6-pyruvoyl-tetrahydropterin synthase [Pantoea phage vB_PagS_Vid5]AVJ51791.1 6-carboxytetrahydropterin synthase [Pantoea phage vB_PagS_Vid5]
MHTVIRSHEICAGHRVVGHESKCRHLHGHNYVFHFKVQPNRPARLVMSGSLTGGKLKIKDPDLDTVGRVVDFSVVKTTLCQWLEDNWDHKFLHWDQDQLIQALIVEPANYDWQKTGEAEFERDARDFKNSLVPLSFNPTAENLAQYMVDVIGPQLLTEHGVELVACTIEETSKCHVEYTKQ